MLKARGVRLGRPRLLPDDIAQRIAADRQAGHTLRRIAENLNREGVATATGAGWHVSTVVSTLRSLALDVSTLRSLALDAEARPR